MATDSLYSTICSKIATLIQGLSLSGVSSTHISVVKVERVREYVQSVGSLPWIIVVREQDKVIPRMNDSYDVAYGVWVYYAAKGNDDLEGSLAVPDQWRQQITRLFQSRSIIASFAITEVYNCRVEPGTPESMPASLANIDMGALKIIVTTREPR